MNPYRQMHARCGCSGGGGGRDSVDCGVPRFVPELALVWGSVGLQGGSSGGGCSEFCSAEGEPGAAAEGAKKGDGSPGLGLAGGAAPGAENGETLFVPKPAKPTPKGDGKLAPEQGPARDPRPMTAEGPISARHGGATERPAPEAAAGSLQTGAGGSSVELQGCFACGGRSKLGFTGGAAEASTADRPEGTQGS